METKFPHNEAFAVFRKLKMKIKQTLNGFLTLCVEGYFLFSVSLLFSITSEFFLCMKVRDFLGSRTLNNQCIILDIEH